MKSAGITDKGKVRENNEDRYLIDGDNELAVFAVADGMGGHAAGEVASSMALQIVHSYLAEHKESILQAAASGDAIRPYLLEMLAQANKHVLQAGGDRPEYAGMGTTLTLLLAINGEFWLAHIGDSRAYLLRDNQMLPLTEDHTLVTQLLKNGQISESESNGHPQRHILTRALGTDEEAQFDILPQVVHKGEQVLLCTDGLYGMVEQEEIRQAVRSGREPETILSELVALANERGGTDNITAVLITL